MARNIRVGNQTYQIPDSWSSEQRKQFEQQKLREQQQSAANMGGTVGGVSRTSSATTTDTSTKTTTKTVAGVESSTFQAKVEADRYNADQIIAARAKAAGDDVSPTVINRMQEYETKQLSEASRQATLGSAVEAEKQRLKEKYGEEAGQYIKEENIARNIITTGSPISPMTRTPTEPETYPLYTGPRPSPGDPLGIKAVLKEDSSYGERNLAESVSYPAGLSGGAGYSIKMQEAINRGYTGYMDTPYGGGMGGELLPESAVQVGLERLYARRTEREEAKRSGSKLPTYNFTGLKGALGKVPTQELMMLPEGVEVNITPGNEYVLGSMQIEKDMVKWQEQQPITPLRELEAKQWREQGVYESQEKAYTNRMVEEVTITPKIALGASQFLKGPESAFMFEQPTTQPEPLRMGLTPPIKLPENIVDAVFFTDYRFKIPFTSQEVSLDFGRPFRTPEDIVASREEVAWQTKTIESVYSGQIKQLAAFPESSELTLTTDGKTRTVTVADYRKELSEWRSKQLADVNKWQSDYEKQFYYDIPFTDWSPRKDIVSKGITVGTELGLGYVAGVAVGTMKAGLPVVFKAQVSGEVGGAAGGYVTEKTGSQLAGTITAIGASALTYGGLTKAQDKLIKKAMDIKGVRVGETYVGDKLTVSTQKLYGDVKGMRLPTTTEFTGQSKSIGVKLPRPGQTLTIRDPFGGKSIVKVSGQATQFTTPTGGTFSVGKFDVSGKKLFGTLPYKQTVYTEFSGIGKTRSPIGVSLTKIQRYYKAGSIPRIIKQGDLEELTDLAGYYKPSKSVIFVDSTLPKKELVKTIRHELKHATDFYKGIDVIAPYETSKGYVIQETRATLAEGGYKLSDTLKFFNSDVGLRGFGRVSEIQYKQVNKFLNSFVRNTPEYSGKIYIGTGTPIARTVPEPMIYVKNGKLHGLYLGTGTSLKSIKTAPSITYTTLGTLKAIGARDTVVGVSGGQSTSLQFKIGDKSLYTGRDIGVIQYGKPTVSYPQKAVQAVDYSVKYRDVVSLGKDITTTMPKSIQGGVSKINIPSTTRMLQEAQRQETQILEAATKQTQQLGKIVQAQAVKAAGQTPAVGAEALFAGTMSALPKTQRQVITPSIKASVPIASEMSQIPSPSVLSKMQDVDYEVVESQIMRQTQVPKLGDFDKEISKIQKSVRVPAVTRQESLPQMKQLDDMAASMSNQFKAEIQTPILKETPIVTPIQTPVDIQTPSTLNRMAQMPKIDIPKITPTYPEITVPSFMPHFNFTFKPTPWLPLFSVPTGGGGQSFKLTGSWKRWGVRVNPILEGEKALQRFFGSPKQKRKKKKKTKRR